MHSHTGFEGRDMDGAETYAGFADNTSKTLTWMADPWTYTEPDGQTYGSINGFANGDDINLFMSWDGVEVRTSRLLTTLSINLAPANAVFDTTFIFDHDPNGGSTQGSSFGFPFSLYSAFEDLPGTINVMYTGIVNLAGSTAAGDLFTTMVIYFNGLQGGGLLGNLSFRTDMDALNSAGTLSPVPLSSSLAFLAFGFLGLGLIGRTNGGLIRKPQDLRIA